MGGIEETIWVRVVASQSFKVGGSVEKQIQKCVFAEPVGHVQGFLGPFRGPKPRKSLKKPPGLRLRGPPRVGKSLEKSLFGTFSRLFPDS